MTKDTLYWKNKNKKEVVSFNPLQIKDGFAKGLTALTDTEVEIFLNPPISEDERINIINNKTRAIIYSRYPLEKQSSAQLGIYGDEYLATMKAFIKQVIDISNKATDDGTKAEDVNWEATNG